jgi:hypothetical protein
MRGYGRGINDGPHLELEEMALAATPDDIRCVAKFLLWAARQMERDGKRPGGHVKEWHRHLRDWWREWNDKHVDVIILVPSADEPKRIKNTKKLRRR